MPPVTYPIHEATLDNGLRIQISPDHAASAVAVNLWYNVGSRHEQPGHTGFAHLFEHLMFQGSAHVENGQHFALLQAAGASVNATTWFDRTNYFEALPTGGLDLALWLEADRMGTLPQTLTQENLDTQREVVKEEKRQRYDNVPYGDVMEHLVRLVFPEGHPYAHTTIGSMADLDAASLEDVHRFFGDFYRPNNAVLTLVGDIEPEEGFAKAAQYFGSLEPGVRPPQPEQEPLPPITGIPRTETTGRVPVDAVHLAWRFPAFGTPGFDALELATSILGGSQTSRLHHALVRGRELAQGAHASSLGLIGGNSFGFVSARAREQADIAAVENALVEEVDRLTGEGPSEVEVRRAQAQFERSWLQSLAHFETRADQLSAFATLFGDPHRINTRIDTVRELDGAAIQNACRAYFRANQRATLIYRKEDS